MINNNKIFYMIIKYFYFINLYIKIFKKNILINYSKKRSFYLI